tara:strand:- start:2908 stop:3195 length:288 start_codon:yes stop_codon:yes gene_type:complete
MIDMIVQITLVLVTGSICVLSYRYKILRLAYARLQDREEILEQYYNEEAEEVVETTHDLNALAERYKIQAQELKECKQQLDTAKDLITKFNNLNK